MVATVCWLSLDSLLVSMILMELTKKKTWTAQEALKTLALIHLTWKILDRSQTNDLQLSNLLVLELVQTNLMLVLLVAMEFLYGLLMQLILAVSQQHFAAQMNNKHEHAPVI